MSPQYSRIFVSINLPTVLLNCINDTVHSLKIDFRKGVRWIKPETAHITVQFVGEIPETILGDLIEKIGNVTPNVSPFTLALKSPEVAPSLKRPKLIWIPVTGEVDEIQHMSSAVRNAVKNCGIILKNRGFSPHITLGRISQPEYFSEHRAIEKNLQRYAISTLAPLSLKVSEIAVVQSILSPSGPKYINRKKYVLNE